MGESGSTEGWVSKGVQETTDLAVPRWSHTIQRKGMGLVLWCRMEQGLAV